MLSFYGSSFTFDGIPSEMYGLIIGDIGNLKQAGGKLGGSMTIYEDRAPRRATGLDYGGAANGALSFPVAFTVSEDNRFLDRYEVAAIAGWLFGHTDFKRLTIDQPDLEGAYYQCRITELEQYEVGAMPVGFAATVTCDGPYAYRSMADTVISCDGLCSAVYKNASNVNDYYLPSIEIACSGTGMTIENLTDGSVFQIEGLPAGQRVLHIDSKNQVMTSSDGVNLYQHWNQGIDKSFPRFLRGGNRLKVSGQCVVTIKNDFPWNVGS